MRPACSSWIASAASRRSSSSPAGPEADPAAVGLFGQADHGDAGAGHRLAVGAEHLPGDGERGFGILVTRPGRRRGPILSGNALAPVRRSISSAWDRVVIRSV